MQNLIERGSGILLHPTSLPGPYPIGDLGPAAYEFVDFLEAAGQRYWQILPLSPTGGGGAPYSAHSAFAGNTLLISPDKLSEDALIAEPRTPSGPAAEYVHFDDARRVKDMFINEAFEKFRATSAHPLAEEHGYFCRSNAWWLDDYAIFRSFKTTHDEAPWYEWADPLKLRDPSALAAVRSQLAREIEREKFAQYILFRQWLAVKGYANDRGIKLIGDIPIFVARDSADVWCNRKLFKLQPDGTPTVVAGVPPDYFTKTGQLWGNPIYDWQAMEQDGFGWWTARVGVALETVDLIRLDHFIGFGRNYEVSFADKTAENGKWIDVPGEALFTVLRQRLGRMPFIAEDLGEITPAIEALRDKFEIPGMRIMQFAFGGDAFNSWLPHNHIQNAVIYTGTHDNDTVRGWYKSAGKDAKRHFREYSMSAGREPHWDIIRLAQSSVASLAVVPAQDLLGLGSAARMNTPGTTDGNWSWRLTEGQLTPEIAARLLRSTRLYGRSQ